MRWSYKTVHFELKKEGLLGSAFIDESEIEESLNAFGQGGWELVSMLETRDGVIAVFKQALDSDLRELTGRVQQDDMGEEALIVTAPGLVEQEPGTEPEQIDEPYCEEVDASLEDEEYAGFPEESGEDGDDLDEPERPENTEDTDEPDSAIGAIRIE